MRAHLFNVHGISLDDDTLTLPDDLKQYYSELPGYKAKCKDCGKTVSFLTNIANLREHLRRRHSIRTQNRDKKASRKKRSKLWNYFEELKPSLVKCTTCKKEIKVLHLKDRINIMRAHLFNVHGISLDDDTFTLPDDLKQYYSELPEYKAKCNDCSKIFTFLRSTTHLRVHLRRRHSIRIQNRDKKASRKKRSKLWNYFEELKPSLVKCTTCKKEIKIPYPKHRIKTMITHLLNKHGIFLDDDIRTLPVDLKQYYSELPGYKAKCKDCSKTVSFLRDFENLRRHLIRNLRRHSTRIQSRDEPSTSSLADNGMDPSAERQSQDTSGLPVQSFKKTTEKTGAFNEPSTSITTGFDTNPTAECQSPETVDLDPQTCEQSKKETRARIGTVTASRRKHSKLWNYFEELKPSLVKCTTCKKEIKVLHLRHRTSSMRVHLLNKHGISLDDDTLTLPDDLKQYYSELPGYKAKCKDCGKTVSFLNDFYNLRRHLIRNLRRHSTRIQSRDEKASRKKRSKLWNYFEELKPSLVKCTTCKKEIKIPYPKHRIKTMRTHLLNKHGIFLDDDTLALPVDLKQYYSELPGYKAKCKECGKTLFFLSNMQHLRVHLRTRHSIKIQSRNKKVKASRKKRSKLWDYFEELKPLLVKCTTCKKEIKVLYLTHRIKIMRAHLLNKHGISLDVDTYTLPDDLRQYYSALPGYKAKCKECGKTLFFLSKLQHLRKHLKRHSTRIQIRDELSTSSLADNGMDPSAERQSQDTSGLPVQSFKETTEKTGAFNKPSTSSLADYSVDPSAERQSQDTSSLPVQSFKETAEETGELNKPSTSSSMDYNTNPAAECQSQEIVDLDPQTCEQSRKGTRARDWSVIIAPKKKRNKLWNYFEELKPSLVKCAICKIEIHMPHPSNSTAIMIGHLNKHGLFFNNDTFTLPDDLRKYCSELPGYKAKCNDCGKTMSFLTNIVRLRKHLRRHSTRILSRDEPSTSSLADNGMDLSAGCQSQDTSGLPSQPFKETTEKTGALNESSTLSLADNGMDPSAERQNQDTSGLPVQSFKETTEKTGALNESSTSSSMDFNTNPSAERQSQKTVDLGPQTCEQSRKETSRARDRSVIIALKKKRSKLWNYFEELKSLLVKCAICKIEIHMPHSSNSTPIMIGHLNRHEIFFNNDTFTLPDDLRKYYSELPGYKAKCNVCSKTMPFLANIVRLRKHLRRHSTKNPVLRCFRKVDVARTRTTKDRQYRKVVYIART
ncbi:uncharacterized protein [Temnothorax nylanderi]|uniref:uncharacterized protein n=1 Tax=Temnothorax nylanderi TaxID=102681 RepID=UPI003A8611AA